MDPKLGSRHHIHTELVGQFNSNQDSLVGIQTGEMHSGSL